METEQCLHKCYMCKERKPKNSFNTDNTRRSGIMSRCKRCDDAQQKRRYDRRQDGRRAILERAKAGPCMDCGKAYPKYVMDLDHRPGTEKIFNLSNALRFSLTEILAELDKCDLVCANCHRERSYARAST